MFNAGGLNTTNNYAPHAKLAHNFVDCPTAHEEFLCRVRYEPIVSHMSELSSSRHTETVYGRAEDHEGVTLSPVHRCPGLIRELISTHKNAQPEQTGQSA